MATLTKGKTFGATETVTNTKLHQLVDSGTVTNIALADFATGVRPATVATGAPSSPTKGDLWVDTSLTNPQVRAARADSTFSKLYAIPPGTILYYGVATAPEGWLLCDGSAVSRTTYADLFGVISTTFGVGDGSTTFNVPDIRGRVPVGTGTGSGLTARTLAATGGTETDTLPQLDLAAGGNIQGTVPDAKFIVRDGSDLMRTQSDTGSGFTATVKANVASGGGSHNTMQPFLVLTGIIRT